MLYLPVKTDRTLKDAAIVLLGIAGGLRIIHNTPLFQRNESVCKTFRDIQILCFLLIQFDREALAKRSGLFAQIHNDILNPPFAHIDQFGVLKRRQLEMHTANHMLLIDRVVKLLKVTIQPMLLEKLSIEQFLESDIMEWAWRNFH